jgi:replicative DNA helicase
VTDDYIVTHNTSIAMQIAEHAGEKGAVLIFSLEMPTHELTSRMLASRARIPLDRLMSGNLNDEQWTALTAATARLRENKVLIVDAAILTITSMRSQCRRVKRKHGLSMIVLDYIQLMTHNKANDVDGLTDISRGLKLIAKELNVPVIALSQLNRSCDSRPDKRPLMPDLRSSGSIEQDADIILMVYRDEVYNPDSDRKGIAELLIRKNRNGGLKDVLTTFIPEFTRFENFFGQIEQQQQSYTPKRRTVKDF